MPHLLRVALKRPVAADAPFPFSVPVIAKLEPLDLDRSVTFFVGENGSGKSTLLEGIALAAELPSLGMDDVITRDPTLAAQRPLGDALRLTWSPKSREGFFMRAEDFFGRARFRARAMARYIREVQEFSGSRIDHETATAAHVDEERAGDLFVRFDARSHGESFMDLFSQRVRPGGLYLLDEPEAPLSPTTQGKLVTMLAQAAERGAQFVIATHSPILLRCPGAAIYSFDKSPISTVGYDEVEHVTVMREFLAKGSPSSAPST